MAVPLDAQERPGPLVALGGLRGGQVLVVRDSAGAVHTGRLRNVSSDTLTLLGPGTRTVAVPLADVRRITIKDSLRNGAIIGAAIGGGAGFVGGGLPAAMCENEGGLRCTQDLVLTTVGGLLGGMAVGVLIDMLRTRTIFDAGPGAVFPDIRVRMSRAPHGVAPVLEAGLAI